MFEQSRALDQGMAGLDQLVPDSAVSADGMQANSTPSSSNPGCGPQSLFPGVRLFAAGCLTGHQHPHSIPTGMCCPSNAPGCAAAYCRPRIVQVLYKYCDVAAATVQQAYAASLYALHPASCLWGCCQLTCVPEISVLAI